MSESRKSDNWLLAPLAVTVFVSACLLFLVQSMLGKHLLPWFGGTPSVWATCMLFFQIALLLGYGYAWLLDQLCPLRWQPRVHWVLVGLSLAVLGGQCLIWGWPLLPGHGGAAASVDRPILNILGALAIGPGLPFVTLSATSPLLQRWAAAGNLTRRPYRLFALSNAGSLIGLFAFPFLLEPQLPLPRMAWLWGGLFALYGIACVLATAGLQARMPSAPPDPLGAVEGSGPDEIARSARSPYLLWLALAACPSALLLATTNHICQEVAVVPMLWILPLAIYLISFILAFDHPRWYSRRVFFISGAIFSLASVYCSHWGPLVSLPASLIVFSAMLFSLCMLCHGELERSKPATSKLTKFYLLVAGGGAIGGLAVAVGAPLLLKDITEFHIAALASWVVVVIVFFGEPDSPLRGGQRAAFFTLACLGLTVLASATLPILGTLPAWLPTAAGKPVVIAIATTLLLALALRRCSFPAWRAWPIVLVMLVALVIELFMLDRTRNRSGGELAAERNFFGVVRVMHTSTDGVPLTQLVHGRINHGFQYDAADLRRQPAGYCGPNSGAGMAILHHPRRATAGEPMRIGVAGLGVGAMAAYLRSGDLMRFYEINPTVIDWAAGPDAYFSYTRDTKGQVETILGDARMSLEQELRARPPGEAAGYDLILLDAFSSDAVPVHLLTVEAFELYRTHLRDRESAILVNISNRFLDFEPLMEGVAGHFGWHATLFIDVGNPPVPTGSLWVLLAEPDSELAGLIPPIQTYRPEGETPAATLLWTDAHSDIFRLLRWKVEPRRVGIIEPPQGLPGFPGQ